MNLIESFKIAIDSIRANRMRSFLTMLGIIIGISSVITIVSLGKGGQNSITDQFEKLGASNLSITVDGSKAEATDYLTMDDIKTIKEKVDTVKYITPISQMRGNASSESTKLNANITGGNADYFQVNSTDLADGRFYNENDVLEGKPVAIIDEQGAQSLFGTTDAVGKTIKIGSDTISKKVTIIGIIKSTMRGPVQKDRPVSVNVPISFLSNLYSGEFKISSAMASATSKEDIDNASSGIQIILESRHDNKGKNVYTIDNLFKQLDQINSVLSIVTDFVAAVAAISLLVGGIGVMNIMLVSVTERTREIGIRKAIGATTKNILTQFLTESAIISLIGGIIGMLLGIAASELIGFAANIVPSISPAVVIGVILFSSAVGLFFGIYPAKKAAQLDPIEALRYE
ncbi:MAG: ABC transporter permease [Bacillota bacterium]|nr:ABC transporter permease [Bacillota bacterium]